MGASISSLWIQLGLVAGQSASCIDGRRVHAPCETVVGEVQRLKVGGVVAHHPHAGDAVLGEPKVLQLRGKAAEALRHSGQVIVTQIEHVQDELGRLLM